MYIHKYIDRLTDRKRDRQIEKQKDTEKHRKTLSFPHTVSRGANHTNLIPHCF